MCYRLPQLCMPELPAELHWKPFHRGRASEFLCAATDGETEIVVLVSQMQTYL